MGQDGPEESEIPLETRRSRSNDRLYVQLGIDPVVLGDASSERVELVELFPPVLRPPPTDRAGSSSAEVPIEVRCDLVPARVRIVERGNEVANAGADVGVVRLDRESDVGRARRVPGWQIPNALVAREQVDPT